MLSVIQLVCFLLFISPVLSSRRTCWRDTECDGPLEPLFPGPWDANNFAPTSRTVAPEKILSYSTGSLRPYQGSVELKGDGDITVLDFGREVGGLIHLQWTANDTGALGLAFTEGKNWIGKVSDSSHSGGSDLAIYANLTQGSGSYVMSEVSMRGGFRYLTLFVSGETTVTISDIQLEISFQPTWTNLRSYQGYFHSSDDTLNKIWYSGAYSVQTNALLPTTGGGINPAYPEFPWLTNGTIGNGSTIQSDGAKRDRLVWPGDMGVAVPTSFYSINDMKSIQNSLETLWVHQNSDGSLPEAGPPYLAQGSDTYHMWTMIGTYNYVLYTGNLQWLSAFWPKYMMAMEYIYAKVDSTGLMNSTGTKDWARISTGGYNSEANMILYRTLTTGALVAQWVNDKTGLSKTYLQRATSLQKAINTILWVPSVGAFKDNATDTTLIPQDANSMAILFGLTTSSQTQSISSQLTTNWNQYGAVSPELTNNVAMFISSLEIQAHFVAQQPARALELIRRSWGWYLNNPNGTQSTVIEGFRSDGTFGYRYNRGYKDYSYTSHSHGWSSGPTSALSEYVVGISVTTPSGKTWTFSPQFGDLKFAQCGFKSSLGKFKAGWVAVSPTIYTASLEVPKGTSGTLHLPVRSNGFSIILVNGKSVKYTKSGGIASFSVPGGTLIIDVL